MSTIAMPPHMQGDSETLNEIDVRCAAALCPTAGISARCQLLAGHDGRHAVMFTRDGQRTLGTWAATNATDTEAQSCESAVMSRPWMRGYPVPAWSEAGVDAS